MDFKRILQETPDLIEKLASLEHNPFPDTPILFAKIKLLWHCNLSCTFCELPEAGKPLLKATVVELLTALTQKGLKKIHYSGGEIFLHPEIFAILEESCALGLQVNLTTNGTLLDREKIKRLTKIKVHSISISLDAAEATLHDALRGKKGAFKATLKAITLLANNDKKRPIIRVNTLVTRKNASQLDALHALLYGISPHIHWKLIPVDAANANMQLDGNIVSDVLQHAADWELLDELPFTPQQVRKEYFTRDQAAIIKGQYGKHYYDDYRCYIPWLSLFIEPTGFVYPCCMSRGRITAFGNIYHNTLDEILAGPAYKELRMNMASNHTLNICRYCDDFIRENIVIEEAATTLAAP